MRRCDAFDSVCLRVCCVSVMLSLESFDLDSSFLVDLENVQVKLVYKGHRVKVKVTGAIKACLCVASLCSLKLVNSDNR